MGMVAILSWSFWNILTAKTKWEVKIGLPYGTSYWQGGDSTEQNGCFKMTLAREKQALVTKKMKVAYLNAWKVSFARVETNWKAVLH
jgi:hypothetical protein